MSEDQQAEEIRRLEALVESGAGALAFPALAEAWRRAGRPEEAERVARDGLERAPHATAGRVALALALLDQKRTAEAGSELERLLGGGAEHGIAHDAAASVGPEGLEASEPRGELATLDPYPDLHPPGDPERSRSAAAAADDPTEGVSFEPPAADPTEGVSFEPPAAGPFGPAPPPAPATPEIFGAGAEGDAEPDADAGAMFGAEGVHDEELDTAFDEAESDAEEMFGADDVARAALATVPDEEDGEAELEPPPPVEVADGEEAFRAAPGSPFATETVAGLLERQGHAEEAGRLREQIAGARSPAETDAVEPESTEATASESTDATPTAAEPPGAPEADAGADAGRSRRPKNQATLERWLDNLRRDKR